MKIACKLFADAEAMSCSSSDSGSEDEGSSSTEYQPPPSPSSGKKDALKKVRGEGRVTRQKITKPPVPKAATTSNVTPKPKKRKGKTVKEVVKMDISKIKEFEVHIGRDWYVK